MQAVYESISPSAVVELASLLSRQDLFISPYQLQPGLLCTYVDVSK